MRPAQRILNIEAFVMAQKRLLYGHQFRVSHDEATETFTVTFEKIAHSTLNQLRNLFHARELDHILIKAKELKDDFHPYVPLENKRRRKRKKKQPKPPANGKKDPI